MITIKHNCLTCGSSQIAYAESTGTGPAVIMLSGNPLSGACFHRQMQSQLAQEYRLIALDLPGTGRSEPANNPENAYSPDWYADLLVSFCSALGIDDAVFMGWSLGGHLLLEAAHRLPSRGYFIFGTPPISGLQDFGTAFMPHPAMELIWKKDRTVQENSQLADVIVGPGHEDAKRIIREDLAGSDSRAREVILDHLMKDKFRDERRVAGELKVPLCIAHGEHDPLINLSYIESLSIPALWRGRVQIIPEAGHAPHMEQPEAFNFILNSFLSEI